jgi:hypothetical protein
MSTGNSDGFQHDAAIEIHIGIQFALNKVIVLQGRLLQVMGNIQ